MRRRVAIYARVSTEHEAQISALSNQVQYYDNILAMHPEWELVERYIDEGITGTAVKKRKNFIRMMEDALNYGNGNILGYNRVGRDVQVNLEQAETVRMIYDLFENGYGIRKIQYELEKRERRTATGKTRWDVSNISRILRNSFYCGIIIYRKQFVPDYLEQKKINNYDMVEKVTVRGTHEALISEEQYNRVQEIIDSKLATQKAKKRRGQKPCLDVYCRKMKCKCNSCYNRKVWHRTKENQVQYAYQCYDQIRTGTVATREKKRSGHRWNM